MAERIALLQYRKISPLPHWEAILHHVGSLPDVGELCMMQSCKRLIKIILKPWLLFLPPDVSAALETADTKR